MEDGVQGLRAVSRGLRASYLNSLKAHHLDTSVYPLSISGGLVTLLSHFHNAKSVMVALLVLVGLNTYVRSGAEGHTRNPARMQYILPLTLQHGYT